MDLASDKRRANVLGLGLIGGSIALGLRSSGWFITGSDTDAGVAARALELGVIDAVGLDPHSEITFVCAPVQHIVEAATMALSNTSGIVTDVGSVKSSVCSELADPRFVGGHPMAGSEQLGVEGARAEMFEGAVWVLTPVESTDPDAHRVVRTVVRSLGADVVELSPERHDGLVAVVSHVPHLTAAALMSIAAQRSDEHAALLRLAAGGFRDMTRIAAGTPTIWPAICSENRTAIVEVVDQVVSELERLRDFILADDRNGLLASLETAQEARRNLPSSAVQPEGLAEARIPILDRPGAIAEVSTLAAELGVNIFDLEIAHSSEGDRGVLILVIDRDGTEPLRQGLDQLGYRISVTALS
ncbi:MAG: prephenate dehydrogenase/arogenate dehydrogenase family protein [Acidimicrobiales bacterium]|nr:prephenate dehydrogenase/arogenate dehydrogenase family protein [Acidimicrobiales bacterium]